MVELRAVSKSFGGPAPRRILSGVSLSVAAAQFVAIVGASGVGKSTLLNVVAGLEPVDSGSVIVDGVDYAGCDDDALTRFRRTRMGFVFQAFHVLPYLTVVPANWLVKHVEALSTAEFVTAVIGLMLGLVMGLLLGFPLARFPQPWGRGSRSACRCSWGSGCSA